MAHPPVSWSLLLGLVFAGLCFFGLLAAGRVPLSYNLRNLVVRWRISAVTALAFTLVVALLLVMLAFVNGMTRLAEGTGHPANVLVLSNGATDELMSTVALSDANDIETESGIVRDRRAPGGPRALCSREIYVAVTQSVPGAAGERTRRRLMQLRGIEDAEVAAAVRGLELLEGRWFSATGLRSLPGTAPADDAPTAIEAVLGQGIAREWRLGLGDVFRVGSRSWVVVGITKSAGSTYGSEIWAKRQLVGQMFGKEHLYTSVVLRTADAASARQMSEELTKKLRKTGLRALPEKEYYAQLAATNAGFGAAVYVVAVIMAVGGVFGVMNTMFAAISQRTQDIGVLRILGFSRRQILLSFFLESLLLAIVGGGAGCALGYLAHGRMAASFLSGKSLVFKLHVDGDTLAVGLLFTLAMGALGGFLPAWSATRVQPLKSLR